MKSILLLGFLSFFIFAAESSQLSNSEAKRILTAMKSCKDVSCREGFISQDISKLERTRIAELFQFETGSSELVTCELLFRKLDKNESCYQQLTPTQRLNIYYFQEVSGSFKLKHLQNQ